MNFGQFCERVITVLYSHYSIVFERVVRERALNIMFENYTQEITAEAKEQDWVGRVQSTALAIKLKSRESEHGKVHPVL